jgi:hypothetical protein
MHQTFRHIVGLGMNRNESVELGMSGFDACWSEKRCHGDKPRQR